MGNVEWGMGNGEWGMESLGTDPEKLGTDPESLGSDGVRARRPTDDVCRFLRFFELILADTISQGDTIAIDKHPEKEELKFEVLKNKVSRKETK